MKIQISEELWPTQTVFYDDWNHRVVGYIGGWGSGKSYIGAQKAFHLAAINRMTAGIVAGPSHGQVMDTSYPTLIAFLEKHNVPFTEMRGQRPNIVLPWGNPTRKGPGWIYFRSLDKPDSIKGLNAGWAWVDEAGSIPKGEEAYQVLDSRVRVEEAALLQTMITTTGEATWVRDIFDDSKKAKYYRASTRENKSLPKSYVEQLEAGLPPHLREVYVDGGFMPPMFGAVYHCFDGLLNVRDDIRYDPKLPLIHSLDFNINPAASVIGQEVDGCAVVLGELVLPNTDAAGTAEKFIDKFRNHSGGVRVFGDPSGSARSPNSKVSCYAVLRREYARHFGDVSFHYRGSDPGQQGRVNPTNALLCDPTGKRRLFVHPRCRHLIHDLRNVVWDERGYIDKKAIHKKYGWTISHVSDGLAYWIERSFPILRPTVEIS